MSAAGSRLAGVTDVARRAQAGRPARRAASWLAAGAALLAAGWIATSEASSRAPAQASSPAPAQAPNQAPAAGSSPTLPAAGSSRTPSVAASTPTAPSSQGPASAPSEAPAAAAAHAYVEYNLPAGAAAGPDPLLPKLDPAARAGIDPAALTHLALRSNLFQSDAMVVLKDGRLLDEWRYGKPAAPIEVGAITQSVTGVAIGRLLYTGQIRSLDLPVASWYPAWKQGPKRAVTLRQLMNHTSGLAAQPSAEEVYASRDLVELALDAPLADPPGTHFAYNQKAVNLLAGIVEKASGRKLDVYLRDEIFAPLGIVRFSWMRDPAGNPHVLAGLRLDALDLARIGQLMLDGGVWRGKRLLAAEFVRESVRAAQPFSPTGGLLWWVIPAWDKLVLERPLLDGWRRGGADPAFLDALAPLAGREIPRQELFATLDRAFGHDKALTVWVRNVPGRGLPTPKVATGPSVGFDAGGAFGQYLVVLPAARLVAVRQARQRHRRSTGDDFEEFTDLIRALVPLKPAAPAAAGR